MRVFIDTNLWVYRLDKGEVERSRFVAGWLRAMARDHDIVISTQVMVELRSVLTEKFKPAWPAADVYAALQALAEFEVVTTDANLVLDGHELADRVQLPWFDGLIAEAAIRSRCAVLYSENFSHGTKLGSLIVCNPFRDQKLGIQIGETA